ncbi:MAG: hypothetical protein ACRYFW_00875 [Janthinobacterium lividum]
MRQRLDLAPKYRLDADGMPGAFNDVRVERGSPRHWIDASDADLLFC